MKHCRMKGTNINTVYDYLAMHFSWFISDLIWLYFQTSATHNSKIIIKEYHRMRINIIVIFFINFAERKANKLRTIRHCMTLFHDFKCYFQVSFGYFIILFIWGPFYAYNSIIISAHTEINIFLLIDLAKNVSELRTICHCMTFLIS